MKKILLGAILLGGSAMLNQVSAQTDIHKPATAESRELYTKQGIEKPAAAGAALEFVEMKSEEAGRVKGQLVKSKSVKNEKLLVVTSRKDAYEQVKALRVSNPEGYSLERVILINNQEKVKPTKSH